MMRRIRGFLIKKRVGSLFRNRAAAGYRMLNPSLKSKPHCISKLLSCCKRLKTKAISLCASRSGSGSGSRCRELGGREPIREKAVAVPKGQMAVYVGGQKDGDFIRVLVPVMYFNHPLFGQLLKEAEKEFGYDHPGGITFPCQISEFENVKHRIAGKL